MDNPISCGRSRRHIEEKEIDILQFLNESLRGTMIAVVLDFLTSKIRMVYWNFLIPLNLRLDNLIFKF
jgi:hypothetical protein